MGYEEQKIEGRNAVLEAFRWKNNRQTVCLGWMSGWTGADNCQRGKKT